MKKITNAMTNFVRKYLPNAFVIAALLTILVLVLGVVFKSQNPIDMISYWGDGFWNFLAFAMQMALVLVTGIVLADIPVVHRFLKKLASLAKNPKQAYVFTFLVSAVAYYINWGLAVIVGAIFARAMHKHMGKKVDFALLIASAYVATATFAGGLSSSVPLVIATPGHFLEGVIGVIPTTETIFNMSNIIILLGQILTIAIVIRLMSPSEDEVKPIEGFIEEDEPVEEEIEITTPANRIENSFIVSILISAMGLIYVISHFISVGSIAAGINLNIINLTFLSLGVLMHKSPIKLVRAFQKAGKVVPPIMLQFPFYAGIMGMLSGSGLASSIAAGMVSIANERTFPMLTYWSAGLVNILAPSAGGQWGIQGPLQVEAGLALGVKPAVTAMAVGWGDAWTNTIQPFWALPILSIAGLKIRDIMGYCIVIGLCIGVVTSILMLFVY